MSIVTINDEYIKDIADSIRQKSGTNDTFKPNEMANAIKSISAGKPVLEDIVINPSINEQVITPSSTYDGINQVKVNAVTSAIDNDIKPENIKKGVSILDIDGTLEVGTAEPKLQTKTVTPKTIVQTIKADNGYDGLSNVTVNAVTNEIDNNIRAENIKDGVSILGVVGNLQTGGGNTGETDDELITSFISSIDTSKGKNATKLPSSLTSINEYAFYYNNQVKFTELPSGVKTIEQYAFHKCKNITFSQLPNNLTKIGSYAFSQCENITFSKLPSTLTSIGSNAFYYCTKITISEIPSGVSSINTSAFYGCSSISELTIKGNITSLGDSCFRACTNLTKLVLPNVTAVATLRNTYCFGVTPIEEGTGYIYVPDDLVESYKTANNWSAFANQIKGISEL